MTKANETAFPVPPVLYGMTMREWFAGMAMQGLLADGCHDPKSVAQKAFEVADAMLAESEKEGES